MDGKKLAEERRSINFFDPNKKIPQSTLEAIVNLAVLAPSAFNLQPWRIIAVKSESAKQRLYALANKQDKILAAPVTLIIIGDRAGFRPENPSWQELAQMLQNDEKLKGTQAFAKILYGSDNERSVKFAESNAGLLAMSLMYAAKYYGVDSHSMSGIDFAGIKTEFGLNTEEEAVMLIALGYFDSTQSLYPRRSRRGYSEIVEEV